MEMHQVTFKLPDVTLQAAQHLAQSQDVTLGQVVRNALANEIRRETRNARTPNRADEQLLAPLQALLAADLGQAHSWEDLRRRIATNGYALREAGGGLALHNVKTGNRICKASELGYSYSKLMRRFREPFPGHAHTHLTRRILGPDAIQQDDIELIEPF